MLRYLLVYVLMVLVALPATAQDGPAAERKRGIYVVKYAAAKIDAPQENRRSNYVLRYRTISWWIIRRRPWSVFIRGRLSTPPFGDVFMVKVMTIWFAISRQGGAGR